MKDRNATPTELARNVDNWRERHGLKPVFTPPQQEFHIHLTIPTEVREGVAKHERRKAAARKAAQTRKARRVP